MPFVLKTIALLGLALTIIPAFAFLFDGMSLDAVKTTMTIGAVLWFGTSPLLQKQHKEA